MTTKPTTTTVPPTTVNVTTSGGETVKVGKIEILKRAWSDPRSRFDSFFFVAIYSIGISLGSLWAVLIRPSPFAVILYGAIGAGLARYATVYRKKHEAAGTWPRNPLLKDGESL